MDNSITHTHLGIIRMDSIKRPVAGQKVNAVKKSKYDWMKRLYGTDDLEIQKTCGTDAALYLIFLRYSAILFFISNIRSHGNFDL